MVAGSGGGKEGCEFCRRDGQGVCDGGGDGVGDVAAGGKGPAGKKRGRKGGKEVGGQSVGSEMNKYMYHTGDEDKHLPALPNTQAAYHAMSLYFP